MTDDYGGNYHPPHAIQHISYFVDTDRPQIFKDHLNLTIIVQKQEKASSANPKPFRKVELVLYQL